jgi:cell division protein FtsA
MNRATIIGAVEIGTAKVVALVGELVDERALSIIGCGQSTAQGLRKGEITDLQAACNCTHAAIHAAERQAGTRIEAAYLAITGAHVEGFQHSGIVTVRAADNIVAPGDVNRAAENARNKALPYGQLYLNHIRSGILLDGRPVDDPVGMQGQRLEVQYWHVHGDENRIAAHLGVIEGFGIKVEDIFAGAIASGSVLVSETEKRQGVLVVDIGAGTTDYVLYRHGRVVRTGVIPVAGDHLTNDLSLGLRIGVKQAENLKIRYGRVGSERGEKDETIMLVGDYSIGDRPLPRASIDRVIGLRVEELLMILKNRLGSALSPQQLPGGVIFSGGTSRLPGLTGLAQTVLGVEARRGRAPDWVAERELREPEFSCALGLLYFGLKSGSDDLPREREERGLIGKLAGIFR